MQRLRTSKLFLFILLALVMVAPVAAVYAEEGESDSNYSAEITHAEDGDDHDSNAVPSSDGGTITATGGIVASLLTFVLLLVCGVAFLAFGVGLTLIAYVQASDGEDE